MRRTPRFIASALSLTIAGAALAACGSGSGNSAGGKTITVLMGTNAQYPQAQRQWFQHISSAFHSETGGHVNFETYTGSSDEQTKLQTAMVGGSGPDVFDLGTTFVPTANATKGFHVLTDADWRELGGRSRFFSQQLTMSGPSPSKDVAVPYYLQPYAMAYNTKLLAQAGIKQPPTTWTQFVKDAQALTNPGKGIYGTAVDPADTFDAWKIIWTFLRQSGGDYLSPDGRKPQFSTPQVRQATQFWFDWLTKYHIANPAGVTWKGPDAVQALATGKAAMIVMVNPTLVPTLQKSSIAGNYAFAPMPTIPYGATTNPPGGVPASTIVSGNDFAIANYSGNTDLALKFIKLVTSDSEQLRYYQAFGDLPVTQGPLQQVVSRSSQAAQFAKAEQGATPTPFSGAWGSVEVAMASVCSNLANQVGSSGHYTDASLTSLLNSANQQVSKQLQP
jgi:multiple sugar transport system substrate-binding protein